MKTQITQQVIDKLLTSPTDGKGQSFIWDTKLSGFGVRVTPTSAAYICQGRAEGKTRRVTIGKVGRFTPAEARKEARQKLAEMDKGIDHSEEKARKKATSLTLAELVDVYIEKKRKRSGKPLAERTKADIRRHLEKSFKDWKRKPVATITRTDCERRYAKLCKASVAQAVQAMRVLSALLNYARKTQTLPDGTPVILHNPVEVLTDGSQWHEVAPRDSAVPQELTGAWWSAVQKHRQKETLTPVGKTQADLVAFLALTGLRFTEAAALTWDRVDLDAGTIRLEDTKNRKPFVAPLSQQALAILEGRPTATQWCFPNRSKTGPLKHCRFALEAVEKASGVSVTPHDLRRTFLRTGDHLDIQLHKLKRLCNHAVPRHDVTQSSYLGEDVTRWRPEAQKIADHFDGQQKIHEGGNVLRFTGSQEHTCTGMAEPRA